MVPPSDPPAMVEGPNHGKHTPTTSVNNKGRKRNIVLVNDGKEVVTPTKKARTTPQMQYATPLMQASTTPKTSSLNATGAMAMSNRGESQGQPTRKRSSQAADDNTADATVTPVCSSKKVKTTKLNESSKLCHTGISCPVTECFKSRKDGSIRWIQIYSSTTYCNFKS